jgi:3',5'-cyclic AMP phosphodiesterase CpdA
MRTLVHLSDLHFGRVDRALVEPLSELVGRMKPDVVVVSGDLTQRARTEQFKDARRFLDSLPSPQIVVPGNHDVPLHDISAAFCNHSTSTGVTLLMIWSRFMPMMRSRFSVSTPHAP